MAVATKVVSPAATLATAARAQRDQLLQRAAALTENGQGKATDASIEEMLREADRLDKRAKRYKRAARVKREPRTYEQGGEHSYFFDLLSSRNGDPRRAEPARERLARHQHEFSVETRTNPSTVLGVGGEFAPPAWMVGLTGPAIAGGRVVADLIDRVGNLFPLPRGVSQVNVPIAAVGTQTTVQSAQGAAVAERDVTTSAGTSQVVTIAGELDASQQLLDLSPSPGFDQIVLNDLTANFNAQLENQMINGSNVNGQMLGLLNVTSIVKFAAGSTIVPAAQAGASNMIAGVWQVLGSLLAQVANGRQQSGRHWVMAGRRWAAIAASLDQQSRPVSVPGSDSPQQSSWPDMGGGTQFYANASAPVGPIMGCPVWQSATLGPVSNVSGAGGAGATDTALIIRPRDLLLWESQQPGFAVVEESLSGTFQVRLQLRKYCAFVPNRYPSGIGAATGMIQPTTSLSGVTY